MRGIGICLLLVTLLALTALAGLAPATADLLADQPYRFDADGRLITDVYVNGHGPYAFLIDTASSRSLIFEHVRAQLGLAQSGSQLLTIYGINDVATAVPVKPEELRIGGEAIRGLTLGVLGEETKEADEPDGVLGIDALSRYFVVLDRSRMRFQLLAPGPETARAYADWAGMPLTPHPLKHIPINFWYLDARYSGIRINTLFDLGAAVTLLNWPAAERLGLHKMDYHGLPPESLRDALGTSAPAVRLENLRIAMNGISWNKQRALVSAAPVFAYFDLDETPAAIVGPGLFKDNSLAMDFAGRRLYVGPAVVE